MANLARHDSSIPAQITHLVGQKYKLMVSISKKWKLKNGEDLSFQVNRIEETCKPELPSFVGVAISESGKNALVSGTSVSGVSGEKLPVLPPILSPGLNTSSAAGPTGGSPASQPRTPPSTGKLTASTPSPRSVAPKRGARRSLFGKSSSDSTVLEDGSSSAQGAVNVVVEDPSSVVAKKGDDVVLDDPSETVAEKYTDALPPKLKRSAQGGKAAGAAKKPK